jgi:beta-glucosidase
MRHRYSANSLVIALAIIALLASCAGSSPSQGAQASPSTEARASLEAYRDPALPVAERVADLLARMSLAEKVGQMTQIDIDYVKNDPSVISGYFLGSVLSGGGGRVGANDPASWAKAADEFQRAALTTRLGIPLLLGIDAVHGHNKMTGTTIFPHNIGMGAAGDADLVEREGRVTALEMRATGWTWNFAPCVAAPQDLRWGRSYEGYGEDTDLVARLGAAALRGMQGEGLSSRTSVLATAKHYLADGGTEGGVDQGDAKIGEDELRTIHMPQYRALIDEGAMCVMPSFSSWNGVKMHGNRYLLTEVLRGELGFKGFTVSDWAAQTQLPGDAKAQIEAAVNAGVDMMMVPYDYAGFTRDLSALVTEGKVAMARIDEAVSRILAVKFEMGLFERPFSDPSLLPLVGSAEHRAVAREAAAKSQVILKNDGVLPLKASAARIIVAGSKASDMGAQCGGWTISWQGSLGPITKGTTIFQGIKAAAGSAEVVFARDGAFSGDADAIIAVVGETPYAEFQGDITWPGSPNPGWYKPRTAADWALPADEREMVKRLSATGIPVVLVVLSGRPIDITEASGQVAAVVAAFLPGTEGAGVADILFGAVKPSGKLSFAWPRSLEYSSVKSRKGGEGILYPLGHGLSY